MSARFNLIDSYHPCRIKFKKFEVYTCRGLISVDVRTDFEFEWDSVIYSANAIMAIMRNRYYTAVIFKNGALNIFRNEDKLLLDYEVINITPFNELNFTYTQIGAANYGGDTHRLYVETKDQSIVILSDTESYRRYKTFKLAVKLPLEDINYNTAYAYAMSALKKNSDDEGIYVALGTELLGGDLFEDISSSIQEIQERDSYFYSL